MQDPVSERVVRLSRRLRQEGLPVGVDGSERFARALEHVDATASRQVYHAARAALVFRREDLALFDRIFSEEWLGRAAAPRGQKMPVAPRHDPNRVAKTALKKLLQRLTLFGRHGVHQ